VTAGPERLQERYGAPAPWARPLTIALVGLVAALGLGWLVWAALDRAEPPLSSQLVSFEVLDAHRVRVRIQIDYAEDVTASCRVTAQASDHGVVGDLTFAAPADRRDTLTVIKTIVTEREATTAVLQGCSAAGSGSTG
jgi:Domain of unknown function (DUF4307)